MASTLHPNYLVSNRKRLALSQQEVAFLLGLEGGETVCRHERFTREPTLESILAYEAIYKRAGSELFNNLYKKVEKEVEERAKALLVKMDGKKSTQRAIHKRQILSEIAGSPL